MINATELKRRKAKLQGEFGKNRVITVILYLASVLGIVLSGWLLMVMAIIIGG